MAGVAVAIEVLAVRDGDVIAEQFKRFVEYLGHARQIALAEEIRCIHDDSKTRRAHLVNQSPSLLRRIDDVVHLRFEGDDDTGRFGNRQHLFQRIAQHPPGFFRPVVRVLAPHAVGIAGPGARRDHRSAHRAAGGCQQFQFLDRLNALRLVDGDHVGRTAHRGDRHAALIRLLANRQRFRELVCQRPVHVHRPRVELKMTDVMSENRIERFLQGGSLEVTRHNSYLHVVSFVY